jgi:hypothetical protein
MTPRRGKALLATLLFLLLLPVQVRGQGHELTLKQKIARADLVALVQVRSKSLYAKEPNPLLRRRAILRVVTLYKGKAEGNEVAVAYGGDANCQGLIYLANDSWLVFLKRLKPGMYLTLNCPYGQMEPWESLLDQVRALTGPGRMMGAPLKSGKPLMLLPQELAVGEWSELRIGGVSPGMAVDRVLAVAGKPARRSQGGRWWSWRKGELKAHFNAEGRVDLVCGPALHEGPTPLLKGKGQLQAAQALGQPFAALAGWNLYRSHGFYAAVEVKAGRMASFRLAANERALRAGLRAGKRESQAR